MFCRLAALLFLAISGLTPAWAEMRPRRIVSLNLCADQYLLALADREQIAALTRFATDPEMSAAAVAARGLPISRGGAEDVLALAPDLIIAAPGARRRVGARVAIGRRNYPTVELHPARSFADITDQIRQVAAAVGHVERGEALIERMTAELALLSTTRQRGTAAYYQRRGFLTGTGTLIDDIMRRGGLNNLADDLGRPVISRLSLEELVAAAPDYLIIERPTGRTADQGAAMLEHPILRNIARIDLPQAWTVCGGPAYVSAVRSLSEQLDAHAHGNPPAP